MIEIARFSSLPSCDDLWRWPTYILIFSFIIAVVFDISRRTSTCWENENLPELISLFLVSLVGTAPVSGAGRVGDDKGQSDQAHGQPSTRRESPREELMKLSV